LPLVATLAEPGARSTEAPWAQSAPAAAVATTARANARFTMGATVREALGPRQAP